MSLGIMLTVLLFAWGSVFLLRHFISNATWKPADLIAAGVGSTVVFAYVFVINAHDITDVDSAIRFALWAYLMSSPLFFGAWFGAYLSGKYGEERSIVRIGYVIVGASFFVGAIAGCIGMLMIFTLLDGYLNNKYSSQDGPRFLMFLAVATAAIPGKMLLLRARKRSTERQQLPVHQRPGIRIGKKK